MLVLPARVFSFYIYTMKLAHRFFTLFALVLAIAPLKAQTDTSTLLAPVTVVYNEDPAIAIIKDAMKALKAYEFTRPDNIKVYASRKENGKELRFEQVSSIYFKNTKPYQEVEAFKDYKAVRADFGNSIQASAQFDFKTDFDPTDALDGGTFKEYPLTNYSNTDWTPLRRVENALIDAVAIPGLLSQGTFFRTSFTLTGEFEDESDYSYTISFAPKSSKGWKGTMIIGGDDFRVRSIKASYGDIYIEQEYSSRGSFYTKNFIWRFSQTEYRQEVISVNTISKPKKNSPMMVAYIPEAANTDPDYWQQYRSIDPEVDAWTRKQDSLIRYLNSDEYLDSADAVYNEFHWYEPLVSGVGYRKRSKGTFFYYSPLIGQWNFVGIGGTRWTPAFIGSKRFSNYQSVEGQFVPNYGFLNNDLKGSLDVEYTYAPMHNGSISLVVADDYEPITQSVDLAGIFARSNFIRKQTVEAYQRYEWFNGFYTRLGLEYSTRSSIEGLQFAQWTNDLFGARNQPAPFETYTVAQLGIEVLIRPFQRYYLKGRRKIVLSSKWPDFRFTFKQGIPDLFGSDVQFSKYEFVVDDMLRFGPLGESFYRFSSGGFLNDPSTVRFIEYKWFRGGDYFLFTHPLYTYQSLEQTFASPSVYLTGSYIHHFDGFFLGKIPGLKKLGLGTSLGATFLSVPDEQINHFESFLGLEKKIKLWDTPTRFGVYYLLQPVDAAAGFRWKISIDVRDTFKDRWNW